MKKLTGSRASNLVVALGVVLVPLIYAALLTLTYQNPTGRLDDIAAAVVNEDTAYTATLASGKTETLSLGADLTQALTSPEAGKEAGFRWQAMNAADAEQAMRTEQVRAILYIPKDFSQKAAAVGESDPSAAAPQTLRLVTDDGINYVTGTMAKNVAEKLTNRLQAQGSEKVLSNLLLSVDTIHTGIKEASDGATAVASAATTLSTGTTTASDAADQLSTGASSLKVGIKDLAEGSATLDTALTTLSDGATKAHHGSTTLADGLNALSTGTTTAADGASTLADGASTAATGASNLSQGTQTLADSTGELATGANTLAGGATTLSNSVQTYTQGVDRVTAGAAKVQQGATALADGLATTKADGTPGLSGAATALADGLATTKADGTPGLSGAVAAYTGSVDQLAQACLAAGDTSSTCAALQRLSTQSAALKNSATQAATGAQALSQGTTKAAQGATALQAGATQAADAAAQIATGATQAATGAQALNTAATKLTQQVGAPTDATIPGDANSPQTLMGGVNAVAGGLQKITSQQPDGTVVVGANSAALRQGAASLAGGASTMNGKVPTLVAGVGSLNDGASKLAEGTSTLSQGATTLYDGLGNLQQGASTAATSAKQLVTGLGTLEDGASRAATGASTLHSGLDTAKDGSTTLADGAGNLAEGAQKLEDGASKLSTGASNLSTGLNAGVGKIPTYTAPQRDNLAQTASSVAQVDAVRAHGVANNGAGFTPMFMSLALWIGGISLFLILPALDKRDHGERWWASAIRPATTALLLAVAQAVLMMLAVNAAGELHAKNLAGLCLMAVATSICFVAINQACVATLAFRGRFISLILLSLQITSMGATFPVETAPRFFQWIHPWLPMSYTQLAFRELIAGAGVDWAVVHALLILAVWTVVAVLATLLGARIRRGPHPLPADSALAPTAA